MMQRPHSRLSSPLRRLAELLRSAVFRLSPSLRRSCEMRGFLKSAASLDRLAAIVEGDVVLKVEEFGGVFSMDCRSDLFRRIVIYGHYEPELTLLLGEVMSLLGERHRGGFDAIDVGANIGFHSVFFVRNGARACLALEPVGAAYLRLQANLRRNVVAAACLAEQVAGSTESGVAEMEVIDGMEEYSSLGGIHHAAVAYHERRKETIATASVDELVVRHGLLPRIMKIDAEGSELEVLQGACSTIASYQPVIIYECGAVARPGESVSARSWLAERGYRFLDPARRTWLEDDDRCDDILAVPASFASSFEKCRGGRMA